MNRLLLQLRRYRHLLLLVALVVMSFAQPLAHGVIGGLIVYDLFLTFVTLAILLIVFQRQVERNWALAIAVPVIATRWAQHLAQGEMLRTFRIGHEAFVAVFFAFAVGVILRGIFAEKVINLDHILGTVCGYVFAGAAWGSCYQIAELLLPGAFHIEPQFRWELIDEHTRAFLFNYYSLSTLTGATCMSVTPVVPAIGTLTWMESLFGQFYLAVVVAQLVSLKLARRAEHGERSELEESP